MNFVRFAYLSSNATPASPCSTLKVFFGSLSLIACLSCTRSVDFRSSQTTPPPVNRIRGTIVNWDIESSMLFGVPAEVYADVLCNSSPNVPPGRPHDEYLPPLTYPQADHMMNVYVDKLTSKMQSWCTNIIMYVYCVWHCAELVLQALGNMFRL